MVMESYSIRHLSQNFVLCTWSNEDEVSRVGLIQNNCVSIKREDSDTEPNTETKLWDDERND